MLGTISSTMVLMACALPAYKLWWPMFVVLFYLLCPIPTLMAKRIYEENKGAQSAMFTTVGIVLSSFALPIVLARASVIQWGASILTLAGNAVAYIAMMVYCFAFTPSEW